MSQHAGASPGRLVEIRIERCPAKGERVLPADPIQIVGHRVDRIVANERDVVGNYGTKAAAQCDATVFLTCPVMNRPAAVKNFIIALNTEVEGIDDVGRDRPVSSDGCDVSSRDVLATLRREP